MTIQTNNYEKFFSLFSEATYMSACVLLIYFTQMRAKALEAVFSLSNSTEISHLTQILAFKDRSECELFLNHIDSN